MTAIFDPSRKPGKQVRTPTAKEIREHPCLGDPALAAAHGCQEVVPPEVLDEQEFQQELYEMTRPPQVYHPDQRIHDLWLRMNRLETLAERTAAGMLKLTKALSMGKGERK